MQSNLEPGEYQQLVEISSFAMYKREREREGIVWKQAGYSITHHVWQNTRLMDYPQVYTACSPLSRVNPIRIGNSELVIDSVG